MLLPVCKLLMNLQVFNGEHRSQGKCHFIIGHLLWSTTSLWPRPWHFRLSNKPRPWQLMFKALMEILRRRAELENRNEAPAHLFKDILQQLENLCSQWQ